MKIFVSYENAHQSVTLAEKDFHNQMDEITCQPVDTCQPVSPDLSLLSGLMNKLIMVAGISFMFGLSNMNLYSPRTTLLWSLLMGQVSASESNTESLM